MVCDHCEYQMSHRFREALAENATVLLNRPWLKGEAGAAFKIFGRIVFYWGVLQHKAGG